MRQPVLRLIMSQYPSAAGDPLDLNGWGNAQDQCLWSIGLRLRRETKTYHVYFSLGVWNDGSRD